MSKVREAIIRRLPLIELNLVTCCAYKTFSFTFLFPAMEGRLTDDVLSTVLYNFWVSLCIALFIAIHSHVIVLLWFTRVTVVLLI